MVSYTVRCCFADSNVADRWLQWLVEEHIQDVLDAGATAAELFEMDSEARTFEIRYQFNSRDEFNFYEQHHAPRLREEGLRKFPLNLGLQYSRTIGETLGTFAAGGAAD